MAESIILALDTMSCFWALYLNNWRRRKRSAIVRRRLTGPGGVAAAVLVEGPLPAPGGAVLARPARPAPAADCAVGWEEAPLGWVMPRLAGSPVVAARRSVFLLTGRRTSRPLDVRTGISRSSSLPANPPNLFRSCAQRSPTFLSVRAI